MDTQVQDLINYLNDNINCPNRCPGRDYDVDSDGKVVCGICGRPLPEGIKYGKRSLSIGGLMSRKLP